MFNCCVRCLFYFAFCFLILPSINVNGQGTSNRGKDFWLGYGNHVRDWRVSPNQGPQQMKLYITAEASTTGKVEIPGIGVSTNFTVTANNITEVLIDDRAKLAREGKYNTGIHVTSEKSVVVYAHIFASNVSGATLVLPTPSLGKEYYSINYTQNSNEEDSYSYFFVVATEDNTEVQITPSQNSISGLTAGNPITIQLKLGEIYQVLSSKDLTGSTIKSVSTTTEPCKRIAVFSGSGKINIGCGREISADNLYQQNYPITSWGKEYVAVPFKSRPYDIIRIVRPNKLAKVTLNGLAINDASFVNDIYEYSTTSISVIKSDLPIQVAQYAITQGNGAGCIDVSSDIGDPEMIYLNSIEQNIQRITMYSSDQFAISSNLQFINVVIPTNTVGSFMLDGVAVPSSFSPIADLPGYSYAQLNVRSGVHNLSADNGFNAIAYGFGMRESYGYSAGTNVKNLGIEAESKVLNAVATAGCVGEPFDFKVYLSYMPNKIIWNMDNGDPVFEDANPQSVGTIQKEGTTYYIFKYKGQPVVYNTAKDYSISVSTTKSTSDACGAGDVIESNFTIFAFPDVQFTSYNVCDKQEVAFVDKSDLKDAQLKRLEWNFGDGTFSNEQNPGHTYPSPGTYLVTLKVETLNGCEPVTSLPDTVIVYKNPIAKFTTSGSCVNRDIVFSDQSIPGDLGIEKWIWIYGDGKTDTTFTNTPVMHQYKTVKSYNTQLKVISASGCESISALTPINITPMPNVGFLIPEACVTDIVTFKNLSSVSGNTALNYKWDFGDPNTPGDVSTTKDGVYKYSSAGTYKVSLTVTSANGCDTSIVQDFVVNGANPNASFQIANPSVCSNNEVSFINKSAVEFGSVTKLQWYFDYKDATSLDSIDDEPLLDKVTTHRYPVHHKLTPIPYRVRLVAFSGVSCYNTYEATVEVKGVPDLADMPSISRCMELGSFQIPAPTEFSGFLKQKAWFYGSAGISENGIFNPYKAGAGTHIITYTFRADNGCESSKQVKITISPTPKITMLDEVTIDDGEKVQLLASTVPLAAKFSWSPARGLSNASISNPVASPTFSTQYTLSVETDSGCTAQAKIYVRVLKTVEIPNAFSPNHDYVNDTWDIRYLNDYKNFTVNVFSRFGVKVFSSVGAYEPWDGKSNGEDLPAGVYFYVVEPKSGRKPLTGYVTLLR